MLILAGIIGFLCGLTSVGFKVVIHAFTKFAFQFTGHPLEVAHHTMWFLLPLVPMIGGLLVGPLSYYFPTETKSSGVPWIIRSAALEGGIIRPRTIGFRSLAAALTIGSGGSAGREAPIVQIGASIGSLIGQILRVSSERMRVFLGCGVAAGIAATFNAPIAGVIFSLEVILGDFDLRSFTPIIFASVIATATARGIEGDFPAFIVPAYESVSHWEIGFYMILGLICGLVARLFFLMEFSFQDFFEQKLKLHPMLKPALGGLLVGFIALGFPQIMGNGYETMNQVLSNRMIWHVAFLLVFLKMVATCLTLGSGGSGGLFAPSMFVGSMVGGTFGVAVHTLFPEITASPGAYALVGMGSVFAALMHAPLTNIFMLFEMTGNYMIILPIMISCIFATLVNIKFSPYSLYTEHLRRKGIEIVRGREVSIMNSIRVADVMNRDVTFIPENLPFRKILDLVTSSRSMYFPVVDEQNRMTGILSFQNIREVLFEEHLTDLVVAKDLITENVITLYPQETLNQALPKYFIKDVEQLPVVLKENERKVIGMLDRKEVMEAYKREVLKTEIKE